MARHVRLAALLPVTAALAACNGSLTVNLTDTPADGAASVVIDFTGMELHNTDGKTVTINFPSPQQIDLMQLQNGATTALIQNQSVPAGTYDWMQLNVRADKDTQGESYITLNTGAQYPLYIPSGSEAGLKLTTSFTVAQNGSSQLLIEFNVRQSVTGADADGQNYDLVPAMRLEDPAKVGTIAANVDLGALASQQLGPGAQVAQCQGGLFVFSGGSAAPQNGGGTSLVDFQPIPYFGTSPQASLSLPNLAKGTYTVAATCNYDLYAPTAVPGQSGYQTLHWTTQGNVSVTANGTATVTLPSGTTSNTIK